MKRSLLPLLVAVGCGAEPVLPPLAPAPVDVEVRVEQTSVASGEPIVVEVTRWTSSDWSLPPVGPVAEALQTREQSTDGPSVVGDRTRVVSTFELSGDDGSHVVVVPPVEATGPGDQTRTIEPPPVFVDIGTPPPPLDGLVGPEGVPGEQTHPTWALAAAGVGAALGFGLLAAAFVVVARSKSAPLPKPAHVIARETWAAARQTTTDDHALALELSLVFRQFLQAVTGAAMVTRTTREIVDLLEGEDLLTPELRLRARRVLDATDRLKFARDGGGTEFFDGLETDFLAVVDALSRPVESEVSDA